MNDLYGVNLTITAHIPLYGGSSGVARAARRAHGAGFALSLHATSLPPCYERNESGGNGVVGGEREVWTGLESRR